ncbi:hypothetical protein MBEHAL_1627 [Halarchaeum acidiphilum MH1-52-1]|uniref:Uncharacterized protein n=1 Tax=Halarchaeum acidiphilum MH1-52-1 TaxID=1261545 RepID=U2YVT3_9EURY|nr:hypothetical protein [Halarchaeum acidiphilum]GAD52867.1 hypothetical protein MBEHAL_1627 [Halarchaeum acidiphilum MH1-52-1]
MPSRPALALCALLLVTVLVAPAAARPPPRDVSGFADFGDGGQYRPYDYPATGVSNVTLTVAVHANGTSAWTEAATLDDPEAARAFRENATLRRAVADDRFGYRFDRHTERLRSRVDGDRFVVTYRLDEAVSRRAGGVLLAPFAYYGNRYEPGDADVTVRAPSGYRVLAHPDAMAVADDGTTLRWNATTGAGDAGVSPGLVTFAPAGALLLHDVRGELPVLAVYGLPTLGLGVAYALLFGLPLGLVTSAGAALAGRRRRVVRGVGLATVLLVGLATVLGHYPATGSVVGRALHPFFLTLAVPAALVVAAIGLALHAALRWVVADR